MNNSHRHAISIQQHNTENTQYIPEASSHLIHTHKQSNELLSLKEKQVNEKVILVL